MSKNLVKISLSAKGSVAIDSSDGRIYVAGDTQSFGNNSAIFLVKFTPDGYLIWQQTYAGANTTHVDDLAVDNSGNAFLTGETANSVQRDSDLFLLKINILGSIVWQQSWGGNSTDEGTGLTLDSVGDIFVTGFTQSLGSNRAGVVLKFSSEGNLFWQKVWNGTKNEEGVKLALDSSESIYLAGNTSSFGAGGTDVLLMKFNSTGSPLWERTWGVNGTDVAQGIDIDRQENVFVSGYTDQNPPCGSEEPFLMKLNASNNIPSSIILGHQYCSSREFTGRASGLAVDSDGNAIATGFTDSQPLTFSSGNNTIGQAALILNTPKISNGTPTFQAELVNGIVSSPLGSLDQFSYYEHKDVLLLKYFANPPTFAVKYEYGSYYGGGKPVYENRSFQIGTYVVREGIPVCCIEVSGWNSSGGVRIVNRSYLFGYEIVVFTVTGPGILQFPDWRLENYYYKPHSALPIGPLFVAITLMLTIAFSLRRKQFGRYLISGVPTALHDLFALQLCAVPFS